MNTLADIPRFYTALAEWCACMIYLMSITRQIRDGAMVLVAIGNLLIQSVFLILTGGLPLAFWIPCMVIAVGLMFLFFWICNEGTGLDSGYYCIHAFVLAELAASLEWQLYRFFWNNVIVMKYLVPIVVCGVVFLIMRKLIRRYLPLNRKLGVTYEEFISALIIGVAVFAVSNLSFISIQTPFSSRFGVEVLNIRTLVDFGGVAILFAHFLQCYDLRMRKELEAMQNVLQNQYIQYQRSKESIDLINRKYHDLKHQIIILRTEQDSERRNVYLDKIETEIKLYEVQNKTGNPVLDTILTSKNLYCTSHDITFTCVTDGKLLDFMDVMDLCTVVGNALDNAIEHEEKVQNSEKRLIHLTLSSLKRFVLLRVKNYCEDKLIFEDGLPATTKCDRKYHGYGLKSIRYVVDKYGGILTIQVENNWFELKVLFPQ